jgi:hypothetical protein
MALRVDPDRLAAELGQPASLMRFATVRRTGSCASRTTSSPAAPVHAGVVFFRDTQLTDPLFRATGADRWLLDADALAHEPELDAVMQAHTRNAWSRAQMGVDRLYAASGRGTGSSRRCQERWPAPSPVSRAAGLVDQMNGLFHLSNLRPFEAADMADAEARAGSSARASAFGARR